MFGTSRHVFAGVERGLHRLSLALIVLLALGSVISTILAAFGVIPWLSLHAEFGPYVFADAGIVAQIGFTILMVALCFFVPSAMRIMRLEQSHRRFSLSMDDIKQAYHESHAADRDGTFKIGSEFDSVRDRIAFLREHPDLGALEPEVLELAAQMSHQSRDLADVYSKDKIERARLFLKQRQQEIDKLEETIRLANYTVEDLKKWLLQVETDEGLVEQQLTRLEDDLMEVLPQLGFDLAFEEADRNVVPMADPKKPKPKTADQPS